MKKLLGRRSLIVGLGILAAPVVAASIAYACTALATLSLNPGQGDPGTTVNGVGRGFSSVGEPVVVRLGGSNGQVLWSGRPDANGSANVSFQIPGSLTAGSYVIMATQNNADGQPIPGSPARSEFTVTGRPVESSTPPQPAAPTQQPASAPAAAPRGASSVAPTAAPAAQPAVAGSVDPVTGQVVAPAAAASASAAPAAPGAAPVAVPVPAVGSNRNTASNVAPRSTMVGTRSTGSPVLPMALVGAGLLLTLAATASVIAGRRRDDKALSLADGRR